MRTLKKEIISESDNRGSAIISDKVTNHADDPFVVKKLEEAKTFIRENGLSGLPVHSKK